MAFKALPSAEYIRQLFDYNHQNGWLIWRHRPVSEFATLRACMTWNGRFAGKRAGASSKSGYRRIWLCKTRFEEHRVIWLYIHGNDAGEMIDHINNIHSDNRIENLRLATQRQQIWNTLKRKDSCSEYKCVMSRDSKKRGKRYYAYITINGKRMHLGTFASAESAHDAYCRLAKVHFGEFFNSGKSAHPPA